jgi:DNA-binding MarR family transcriptional regulator
MHYTITDNAIPIIDEISDVKNKMEAQILKGITQEELDIYKKITKKMMKNIRELL